MGIREEDVDCCGSVLNITGAALTRRVQEEHLKKDPNRIPLLFMRDVIHGFHDLSHPAGTRLLLESRADAAIRPSCRQRPPQPASMFSPMADLVRDARWGRVMEAREDPWLNALYARAMVEGYQGRICGKTTRWPPVEASGRLRRSGSRTRLSLGGAGKLFPA